MEFPRVERLLEKNRSRGFVVLAVNVTKDQDDDVLPFVKQNRYTFTPLKGATSMFTAYGVRSVPTEVIIDREGRAVAQVRLNNDSAEQTFQNLLENLLPPAKGAAGH